MAAGYVAQSMQIELLVEGDRLSLSSIIAAALRVGGDEYWTWSFLVKGMGRITQADQDLSCGSLEKQGFFFFSRKEKMRLVPLLRSI
jgi:hypothetical protein